MLLRRALFLVALLAAGWTLASTANAACCYFSAKDADVLQPGQKVFITWDPAKKLESFTVQPKFEGNALDFGMVIPTPSQPKLHEMPGDFFKNLAVYSILMQRESPVSKLLPRVNFFGAKGKGGGGGFGANAVFSARPRAVIILETGVVGSLDYKIISADRADDLYKWLKDNKYQYGGDEATLNHYVQQKWIFTVMKIDTMQMKKDKKGGYTGEVTPTRFQFTSKELVYPLKITQISVKDKTEALFYVQAPHKVDLKGDLSYQHTWVPMLQASTKPVPGYVTNLPGKGTEWLTSIQARIPALLERNKDLGWVFVRGQRPQPGTNGHTPTTMEWARKLTDKDIGILRGEAPYTEKVPNVDEGFTQADVTDPKKRDKVIQTINERLEESRKSHPTGYAVRKVPADDIKSLQQLVGHLQAGLWITKFRKIFKRDEMNADLLIVAARVGDTDDFSEYTEVLPASPP